MRLTGKIKLAFSALAALLLAGACSGREETAQKSFEVSPSVLNAGALGGTVSFTVASSEDWMATSDQGWAKLMTVSGKGSQSAVEVKVSVQENTATSPRNAKITVSTLSGTKKQVELQQEKGSGGPVTRGISTVEDLMAFAAAVNGGGPVSPYMVDGAVTLLNDIDASSIKEWIPVGTAESPLCESFDGKGHSIRNVNWTVDAQKYPSAGFIGVAKNIKVSNLTFGSEGSSVTFNGNASGNIGGIAGSGVSLTCTAVTNKASLKIASGSASLNVGGICGSLDAGSVLGNAELKKQGCVNDGDISASFACNCGGLAGYSNGVVVNCTNNAAISGKYSSDGKCGPAWGCAYNAKAANFTSNYGYGSVNGRASVHATAVVYPADGYDLSLNTVDWTQDTYFDWDVLEEKQLHSGVKYFHASFTGMPRHMHVLQIDLSNPEVELTTAYAEEQVPNPNANKNSNNGKNLRETLSEVCARRRASGQNIIAGINSGFFDSNDGISRGFHIEEGEPVYVNNPKVVSGLPNHSWGLTVFTDGTASCGKKSLSATLEAAGAQYRICSVNDTIMRHTSKDYPVNMYTSRYRQYPHPSKTSITNPLAKDALYVIAEYKDAPVKVNSGWAEAVVTKLCDGRAAALASLPYLDSARQLGFAVSGSAATALAALKEGDVIRLKFDMTIDGVAKPIYTQNSSMYKLMDNGADASSSPGSSSSLYTTFDPMTFPVVSKDGKTVWLVEVDGRQPDYSIGLKGYEMYRIAKKLGGWNMTRFDGGGSSCMWVYDAAKGSGKTVNRVSDSKGERSCLNYMLVRLKK